MEFSVLMKSVQLHLTTCNLLYQQKIHIIQHTKVKLDQIIGTKRDEVNTVGDSVNESNILNSTDDILSETMVVTGGMC